ncbi:ATP-binding protein [Clostridium sp. Marseille-Q7071]
MNIDKLCLYNFRIYNGKKEFNFKEKKLVVFLGPNGSGKSAIYDAIEWAMTGDISRYSDSKESNFNFVVNNKSFNLGCYETYVEIVFDNGMIIRRSIEKREGVNAREVRRVIINGKSLSWGKGTSEIYSQITGDCKLEGLDRFTKTFKASTILSQDELSNFVLSDKPEERLKLFMDILSLEGFGVNFKRDITSNKKDNKDEIEKNITEINKLQVEKEILIGKLKQKETELRYEQGMEESNNIYNKDELINMVNTLLLENKVFIGKELTINDISIKSINILSELIKELMQSKEVLKSDIEIINSCSNKNLISIEDLKLEENNLSENIINENSNKSKVENSIRDYIKQKFKIETLANRLKKYKFEQESLKNIKEKVLDLENEYIGLQNKLEEEGVKSIEEFEIQKSELLESEKLFNNILECKKIINGISELKIDLKENEKLIEVNRKRIEETFLKLQNIKSELEILYKDSKNNKQTEIDKIIYTIQEEIIEEKQNICLVCGNDFSTGDQMANAIEVLRKAKELEKNVYNKKILELENLKNHYTLILADENRKGNDLANSLNKITDNILNNEQKYNIIAYNIKDLDINRDNQKVEDELRLINSKVVKFLKLDLVVKKLEDVKVKLDILKIQKKHSETKIEDLFELISNGYKELTNEWKFDSTNFHIDLDKKNIINLDNILVKVESKFEDIIKENKEKLGCLKSKIITDEKELQEIRNKILIYDNRRRKSEDILKKYNAESFEQFIIKSDNYILTNGQVINKLKEKINLMNNSISNTKILVLNKDIGEINKNIVSLDNKLLGLGTINKGLEDKINMLNELSDNLPNIMSDLLAEFLKISNKEINKNFVQVSPYINNKYINIVSRDGGLYVLLTDSEEYDELVKMDKKSFEKQVNASMTLSSAQSNILALSVFLTSNKINIINNFEIIGLDDPFQNMDDINIYSLIDILCDLMESKQVLVSTHDNSFVNLLVSKSGLRLDQTEIVEYITYDENGVYILGDDLGI